MAEHDCKFESVIVDIQEKVSLVPQIYDRLIGDPLHPDEKPGLISDVAMLKAWKSASTTRIKRTWAWVYGVFGSIIGGTVVGFMAAYIFQKTP